MKFTPVEKLPERRGRKGKLQKILTEFAESKHQIVKVEVDEGEYKDPRYVYAALQDAIKRSHYPLKVAQRDNVVYLMKVQ